MGKTLFIATILLAASLSTVPGAAQADDDVTWLAQQLGVSVADLPETIPGTGFTVTADSVTTWETKTSIADVADQMRTAHEDVTSLEEPDMVGFGVRELPGDGVSWTGLALGESEMPCLEIETLLDPEFDVPATPINEGGPLQAGVSVHLPTPEEGSISRVGSASMDQMLYPTVEQDVTLDGTYGVDMPGFVGSGEVGCRPNFNLRLTWGSVAGDGVLVG